MSTSKLQEQTKERLEMLLAGLDVVENYRPDWLINPQTESRMELDFWLPSANVAIEVQGRQHFEYTPHFHASIEDFTKQKERDNLKRELCRRRNILLFEICSPDGVDALIRDIEKYNASLAKDLSRRQVAIRAIQFFASEISIERAKKRTSNKRQRRARAEKINRLIDKIKSIAERYSIPLRYINLSHRVSRISILYPNCPTVQISRLNRKRVIHKTAAIMRVERSSVILRWFNNDNKVTEAEFDKTMGFEVTKRRWQIKEESLIKGLRKYEQSLGD